MRRKQFGMLAGVLAMSMIMTACGQSTQQEDVTKKTETQTEEEIEAEKEREAEQEAVQVQETSQEAKAGDASAYAEAVQIELADSGVTVNGEAAATEDSEAVYVSHDIIYYEDKDQYESGNPYGEGTDADKHTAEEAAAHTVLNITKPGTYQLTGALSAGQIFVNVGEEETDQVTLILNGVDITCEVAPAVLFYEVYECDEDASEETATKDVDTSKAGAKVVIADSSVNNVSGSYVARIYKDNDEQKKLHKYDGAFYSKVSMEIDGGEKGDGVLNIHAENEGLGSEMHLTILGGTINIKALNDGINTSEDNISVCTIQGGNLNVVSADGEEGDGIDSNGWLVINGGTVIAASNPTSADAGIDSDKGIYINGGTVVAFGNMYDNVEEASVANTMVLQFASGSKGNLAVKDANDAEVITFECVSDYSNIVISSELLTEGTYHLYQGDTQLAYSGSMMGMGGRPGWQNGERPQLQEGERPEMPNGERPQMPDGEASQMPDGEMPAGEMPDDREFAGRPGRGEGQNMAGATGEKNTEFEVKTGVNLFGGVMQ